MTTLAAILDALANLMIIIVGITLVYAGYLDAKGKKATQQFLDAINTRIERENRPDT